MSRFHNNIIAVLGVGAYAENNPVIITLNARHQARNWGLWSLKPHPPEMWKKLNF